MHQFDMIIDVPVPKAGGNLAPCVLHRPHNTDLEVD
jgi:hypothetical protein